MATTPTHTAKRSGTPDPSCYSCRGTGRTIGFGSSHGQPCPCLPCDDSCEPDSHSPACNAYTDGTLNLDGVILVADAIAQALGFVTVEPAVADGADWTLLACDGCGQPMGYFDENGPDLDAQIVCSERCRHYVDDGARYPLAWYE